MREELAAEADAEGGQAPLEARAQRRGFRREEGIGGIANVAHAHGAPHHHPQRAVVWLRDGRAVVQRTVIDVEAAA